MKYFFSFFVTLILSLSQMAQAEIFECRDAKGRVSFGDTPCPIEQIKSRTKNYQIWQDLHDMVYEGYEVYSVLGPDVYSIMACIEKSKAYNTKLDVLTQPLNQLDENAQARMKVAVDYLKECGECRVSAPNYCSRATKELLSATGTLAKN